MRLLEKMKTTVRGGLGGGAAGPARGACDWDNACGCGSSQVGEEARTPRSARCARTAHARLGAAFSLVLAGTLTLYLCGGSFASVPALAAEGSGSQGAGGAASGAASGATVNATPKEEVVYARLSAGGAVDNVYVVNVLKPTAAGSVTDFGSYSAVQNLTDASGIQQNGDAVTVDVSGDSLSYQGDLGAAALPWDVSIVYELDGKRVDAADLSGKSGTLGIAITTKKNASVDPAFFDNYLLQITVPFASDQAKDVATEDGQIALAGSNTQVTFTGMPGKDGTFKVEAQVSDFSFAGVSFAAVPFSMGIETPDTTELVSGFRQLGDGVGQLKTGADGVASGAGSLASGVGQVASGVNGLASGAGELASGAGGVASGAQGVASGASGLANGLTIYQNELSAQAAEMIGKVDQDAADAAQNAYASASMRYTLAFIGAYTPVYTDEYEKNIQTMDRESAIQAAMSVASLAAMGDASVIAAQANLETALTNLVAINATNAGYGASSQSLAGAASGVGSTDNAESLLGGATALASGASELAGGAGSLASGTSAFASGANQAASGAGQLASGATELSSGAQQLASGTGALYQEVQGMPDKVQQEIDAMMASYDKSDFKPVSFASSKNTGVTLVQFVMSTDPIEAPTQEEPVVEEPEQGIWDRLLALFGLS
ncbi:hypothetical protein C1878_11610 [Gordonibacter sp. 28C]|uniref:hypothetical protein n=1 Tax=Gordonibacter sp. 28C TaxID=2078569 RepID=UPI000DF81411|nr:hypothetical protein [Gordonibacter sp. 28C]RDB61357.1 hypothetical protein C1878_11610 [Gordonibacter sp. 28C]